MRNARRLAYIMNRYFEHIEADFAHYYPGIDPGDLWRSRQWRKLLNLIDHLPRNTYFSQAVTTDPEHARMLVEARERQDGTEEPYRPPLATYSAEVEMLTAIGNELRLVRRTIESANGAKHGGAPVLYPQPYTALEQAKVARREEKHKVLVARMLPHKTQ